ncbi:MAG: hypothetical protein U0936_11090 [Planctomycetaceae bacterium]
MIQADEKAFRRDEKGRPIAADGYPLTGLASVAEVVAATGLSRSQIYAMIHAENWKLDALVVQFECLGRCCVTMESSATQSCAELDRALSLRLSSRLPESRCRPQPQPNALWTRSSSSKRLGGTRY